MTSGGGVTAPGTHKASFIDQNVLYQRYPRRHPTAVGTPIQLEMFRYPNPAGAMLPFSFSPVWGPAFCGECEEHIVSNVLTHTPVYLYLYGQN